MQQHERPRLARRGFLSGLAVLPAAAAISAPATPGRAPTVAPDLDALWVDRQQLLGAYVLANAAHVDALDKLPWWVKPGPDHVRPDGVQVGARLSFPAIQDMPLSNEGYLRCIRPSPASIEKDYRLGAACGPANEAKAAEVRDRRLAKLREREAAALIERERLGEPALDAASNAACDAWFAAEDMILEMEPATPAVAAMQIMARIRGEASPESTWTSSGMMEVAFIGLRALLPMLVGTIAADAADFIADPERPIRLTRAWLGTVEA